MHKKDLVLMAYLRMNARMPLTKMSRKTGVPVSTIFDRLKAYKKGLISKHVALVDFSKVGYSTQVNILLKVQKSQKEEIGEYLKNANNVNSLAKVNNGYDFLAECIFKGLEDFEEFMDKIEGKFEIKQRQTYHVINSMKRETFLDDPALVPLLFDEKLVI